MSAVHSQATSSLSRRARTCSALPAMHGLARRYEFAVADGSATRVGQGLLEPSRQRHQAFDLDNGAFFDAAGGTKLALRQRLGAAKEVGGHRKKRQTEVDGDAQRALGKIGRAHV